MHTTATYTCALCSSPGCTFYLDDNIRTYLRCPTCGLVFVPKEYHLDPEEEKRRYGKHTNYKNNKDYVEYLSVIADKALALPVQSPRVLDFGSGPEQVLADILTRRGVQCASHDPLYGIDAAGSGKLYDIVVACEVFEHLRDIQKEIRLIGRLLKPDGFVYVHTQLYDDVKDFPSWWYLKDLTHINFYCEKTLGIVAELTGKKIYSTNKKDTVIFK